MLVFSLAADDHFGRSETHVDFFACVPSQWILPSRLSLVSVDSIRPPSLPRTLFGPG